MCNTLRSTVTVFFVVIMNEIMKENIKCWSKEYSDAYLSFQRI